MIRLRYTGLMIFVTQVLSFFTGFIYLGFVARSLSTVDYGVWRFIQGTLVYFYLFQNLIPFWALRDCSRGLPVEKTAIFGSLFLSIPFTALFLLLAPNLAKIVDSAPSFFYLSCILIPAIYIMQSLDVIIRAKFPHKLAYKNIILDFLKTLSILWLIQFGLIGVIISFACGLSGYIVFALYTIRNSLRDRFNASKIKQWLSSAWVILYGQVGTKIYIGLDIILLGILGSKNLGAYSVAETITSVVGTARGLSFALYPKLLSKESQDEASIRETVMLLLMFLIPMAVGCILLAPNLIEIFGSKYLEGLIALKILVMGEFISVMSVVDRSIVLGTEKIDMKKEVSFSDLLKSKIFLLESLSYMGVFIAIPIMVSLIPKYDIVGCAISIFVSTASMSLLNMLQTRFKGLRAISKIRLTKFLTATCVMSAFVILFYSRGTLNTLFLIASASVIYFISLATLDKETRSLGKKVLNELKDLCVRRLQST